MTDKASNAQLVGFLRDQGRSIPGLISRLKATYRPAICPLDDLLELLTPGTAVMDIGCGNGAFLALIAKYKSPSRLGGIEISSKLVASASALLSGLIDASAVGLSQYDGRTLPDRISEYDTIVVIDVLHHLPPDFQQQFLVNLRKRMRPGARLILKDMDASRPVLNLFNKLNDLILSREISHEITPEKALAALKSAGFEAGVPTKRRMLVYAHYTIICRAP